MQKTRKILERKDYWRGLCEYVDDIEKYINTNPNIVIDKSKSLIETVCKTILWDKWEEIKNDDFPKIVKQTLEKLPFYSFLSDKDQERTKSIIWSIWNIIKNIWEFRNNYWFYSHWQDLQEEKISIEIAQLISWITDVFVSFFISLHSTDLLNKSRWYYEDYKDFNDWFDAVEPELEVWWIILSPSKVLFNEDIEAYKEKVFNFYNSENELKDAFDNFENKDIIIQRISEMQIKISNDFLNSIHNYVEEINQSLKPFFEQIQNINKSMQPTLEQIKTIQKNFENIWIKESLESMNKNLENYIKKYFK